MSSLPDFFLASWQARQFLCKIGATSLMKLTGPFGPCPKAGSPETNKSQARARVRTAQRMQQHERRLRNIKRLLRKHEPANWRSRREGSTKHARWRRWVLK